MRLFEQGADAGRVWLERSNALPEEICGPLHNKFQFVDNSLLFGFMDRPLAFWSVRPGGEIAKILGSSPAWLVAAWRWGSNAMPECLFGSLQNKIQWPNR